MIAIGGLDDSAVAHGPLVGKAPVVELGDHLTGVDVLIETAGALGAGVLGVLAGQLGEALLGGVAGQPLVIDPLGLGFGCRPALVALGVLGLDQNMTDIDHILVDLLHAVVGENGLGVLVKIGRELLVGEGELHGQGIGVAVGNLGHGQELAIALQVRRGAEVVGQIGRRIRIAVLLGHGIQIGLQIVQRGLGSLVQGEAGGLGGVIEGRGLHKALERRVQEHLLPGAQALGVQLLVQRLGGVHHVGQNAAVGTVEGVELLIIVVQQLPVGEAETAGGGDDGVHHSFHLLGRQRDGRLILVQIGVGDVAGFVRGEVQRVGAVAIGIVVKGGIGGLLLGGHRIGRRGCGGLGGVSGFGGVPGLGCLGGIRDCGIRLCGLVPVVGALAHHHGHGQQGHQNQSRHGGAGGLLLGAFGLGGRLRRGGFRSLGSLYGRFVLRGLHGRFVFHGLAAGGTGQRLVLQLCAAVLAVFHGLHSLSMV